MTATTSAAERRRQGPDLLQARFAERLRELLPGGDLMLSRAVRRVGETNLEHGDGDRLTWTRAGRTLTFQTLLELTPSLAKLQALPEVDLEQGPIRVLLAPRLPGRAPLRLEQLGWSYFTANGPLLIQHHDPLIAIRVTVARPTVRGAELERSTPRSSGVGLRLSSPQ